MMTSTLEDVRVAIAEGKRGYWGAMNVYVTGYVAENEFPWKFLYKGCTEDKGNGFRCCKSLERGPYGDHGQGGTWSYMFCFDLYVVDSSISYTAWPLRMTIFYATIELIGMTPYSFQERNQIAQMELVHAATQKLHIVCLYLSFNPSKDSFPIVDGVWMDKDGGRRRLQTGPRTPVRTPIPAISQSAQSAPRPSRRMFSDVPSTSDDVLEDLESAKKETARKLLDQLIEVLGDTKLASK